MSKKENTPKLLPEHEALSFEERADLARVTNLLDLYWPHRTPAKIRSDEEDKIIQNWLAAFVGDFPEPGDVEFSAFVYDDCPEPPAYTGSGTELGKYIEIPVTSSGDDGYWYQSGSWFFEPTDGEFRIGKTVVGPTDNNYKSWCTFQDLPLSSTSRINKALLTVVSYPGSNPQTGAFEVEVTSHCGICVTPTSATQANNITTCWTSVPWNVGATGWSTDSRYNSPDIATVIHDVITNPAWAVGADLSIYILDVSSPFSTSWRQVYSYDEGEADGFEPILKIWYQDVFNDSMSGGVRLGGAARVDGTTNIRPTGGVVCSGLADPTRLFMEGGIVVGGSALISKRTTVAVSGGAAVAGSSIIQNTIAMTGGIRAGGQVTPSGSQTMQMTGGAIVSHGSFSNGYAYRLPIVIASGFDIFNFHFMAKLEVEVGSELRLEDSNGNAVLYEIRQHQDNQLYLSFKVTLLPTTEQTFYLYYGG